MDENNINTCLELVYDAQLTLVNWLLTRTQQRRLKWAIEPDAASTTIPGPILLQFITCPPSIASGGWCLFSARDNHGELFRVVPSKASPLAIAVACLFRIITDTTSDCIH